jgi:arylsulfatase A-like enzyme
MPRLPVPSVGGRSCDAPAVRGGTRPSIPLAPAIALLALASLGPHLAAATTSDAPTRVRFPREPAAPALAPSCPSPSSLRIVTAGSDSGEMPLPCSGWRQHGDGLRFSGRHGVRRLAVGRDGVRVLVTGDTRPAAGDAVEVRLVVGGVAECARLEPGTDGVGPCRLMPPRPNFVVILLDDARADGVDRMSVLETRLAAGGHRFTNAFTPDASCCPSRASLLTGLYALHHGTRQVHGRIGGAHRFRELGTDHHTIAVWLQRAGYRTGLFGKYLNAYDDRTEKRADGGLYLPPGWDRWWAIVSPERYGGVHGQSYEVVEEDGSRTRYDDHADDAHYSTDLGAAHVREFVGDAVAEGRPFFVYWTPLAPHLDSIAPAAPAARHYDQLRDLELWRPPSWNETDRRDKPRWLRAPAPDDGGVTDLVRQRAYEALLAVDEQLGALLDLLATLEVERDTVVVVTSDNGVGWGEHGLFSQRKGCPYEECQRVPLVVRYPRLGGGSGVVGATALNLDVAPTLAALAGVATPPGLDGASLVPWLAGDTPRAWRTDYLLESWRGACQDQLGWSGQPADGDRVRLFHGDPWASAVRPSAVFEFDTGNGLGDATAHPVPIGDTPRDTFAGLGRAVAAVVPDVQPSPSRPGTLVVRDTTPACHGPYWWEEVDRGDVMKPLDQMPDYFGVRDVARGYTWVEYETGERELYDLNADPHQLESRHDDPAFAGLRNELHARLVELRGDVPSIPAPPRPAAPPSGAPSRTSATR